MRTTSHPTARTARSFRRSVSCRGPTCSSPCRPVESYSIATRSLGQDDVRPGLDVVEERAVEPDRGVVVGEREPVGQHASEFGFDRRCRRRGADARERLTRRQPRGLRADRAGNGLGGPTGCPSGRPGDGPTGPGTARRNGAGRDPADRSRRQGLSSGTPDDPLRHGHRLGPVRRQHRPPLRLGLHRALGAPDGAAALTTRAGPLFGRGRDEDVPDVALPGEQDLGRRGDLGQDNAVVQVGVVLPDEHRVRRPVRAELSDGVRHRFAARPLSAAPPRIDGFGHATTLGTTTDTRRTTQGPAIAQEASACFT